MPRTVRRAQDEASSADLVAIAEPIRRAVAKRLSVEGRLVDADVDDVVQEALARVWAVRWRLEREALLAYGLVVARNLVSSSQRQEQLRRRHEPRLADPPTSGDPAADVLDVEEREALLTALAAMRAEDRRLLVEHEANGVEARKIAAEEGLAPAAVAARLARARARLRVDHLLALRHVTLPTPRCRGVLDAISLGDRRRQRTLGAAEHLAGCATCAALAEPLVTRRRSLTGLAPVALLAVPGKWLRAHWPSAVGGTATATAVAVTVGIVIARDPPPPPAQARPVPVTLSVGGDRVLPAAQVGSLRDDVGRPAVGRDVPVQSVPADEGFWVGAGPGRRVWVQLKTTTETTIRVRRAQHASFTGTVEAAPTAMPAKVGLSPAEGAAELRSQGAYVLVDPRQLVVH